MTAIVQAPSVRRHPSPAVTDIGNTFVDAGPGTGKTHTIVDRVRHLAASGVDPREILVVTFSRRAAAELRVRIARGVAAACDVRTFHGFASRVLEADGPRFRSRRLLDGLSAELVMRSALRRTAFATLSDAAVRSERFRAEFARFVADLRRASAPARARLRAEATPRLADLFAAYDTLAASYETLRASDLDDLVARAVDALADPASAASVWLAGRYAHVLVDEFQDVDATQIELLDRLRATIFAVGDSAQAIYAFRGALAGAIDLAVARFAMRRRTLDESRRCPQDVCDLAARTPLLSAKPLLSLRGPGGSIVVRAARTTLDEAALIADRVEDAVAAGLAPERIAVLVRAMRPLGPAVEAELRTRGLAVAGGGTSAFLGDPHVETLRLALRVLEAPELPERWFAFLAAAGAGFDALAVREAFRDRTLRVLDDGLAALAACARDANADPADPAAALRAAAEAFAADRLGLAARRLVRGLGLAARAARDPGGVASARAAVERLGRVADALAAAQRNLAALGEPATSAAILREFETHVEAVAGEATPDAGASGVRVLTVHAAKGLEFDLVVIGDAVEGRFPTESRRSALLDHASLRVAADAGVDLVAARDEATLRDEAALWYVAVTRTRGALFVTYASHGDDGTPQRPSRFIPVDLRPAAGIAPFERRLERAEDLARASDDPSFVARVRATFADSPARVASLERGTAAFAPLAERPVTFAREPSVSAAETWLQCPRRFYYRHVLGLDDEPGFAAALGSALHAILAAFHAEYRDFTAVAPNDSASWTARLLALREREWETRALEPPEKRDAAARFADRVLAAYAVALAEEAARAPFTVIACEGAVASRYGAGVLRGKLDRVDRRVDGTLILRDYKSGRQHEPLRKLLANETRDGEPVPGAVHQYFRPQLALYRRGAEAAFGARVSRLEYAYLNGAKDDEYAALGLDALDIDAKTEPELALLDARVERDFVGGFTAGVAGPIATALKADVTCTFCAYRRICPGPAC